MREVKIIILIRSWGSELLGKGEKIILCNDSSHATLTWTRCLLSPVQT